MSVIIFVVVVVGMLALAATPYLLTSFEYHIGTESIQVAMHWCHLITFRKIIPWSSIRSVQRAQGIDVIPLIGGSFPSLWGKPPGRVVKIIHGRAGRLFPLLIIPPDADDFILEANARLSIGPGPG